MIRRRSAGQGGLSGEAPAGLWPRDVPILLCVRSGSPLSAVSAPPRALIQESTGFRRQLLSMEQAWWERGHLGDTWLLLHLPTHLWL